MATLNSVTVAGGGTVDVGRESIVTFSNDFQGSGALAKNGAGTLALRGDGVNNTYSGSLTVNAGALSITSEANLGSAQLTLNSGTLRTSDTFSFTDPDRIITLDSGGGTFDIGSESSLGIAGPNTGPGALTKTDSGNLTLSGNNTYSGGTNLNGGSLTLGSENALGTEGTITFGGGNLRFTENNTTDYSGHFSSADEQQYILDLNGQSVALGSDLTGANSELHITGSGSLTLTGALTQSNRVTVANNTTLALGASDRVGSSTILEINNGTFDLGEFNQTLQTARLVAGTVTGSDTLTADSFFAVISSGNISANLTGTALLTKEFDGTLTLSGNNTFTGGTMIEGGLINFNSLANFGTGQISIAANAGLQWASETSTDVSGRLNPIIGPTVFDTNGNNVTFANAIVGEFEAYLVKQGAGALTLAPNSTFGFGFDLQAGTISISADSALCAVPDTPQAGHLFFSGGTLRTTASFEIAPTRSMTLTATGGTIETDSETTLTFNGELSGSGDLTKDGAGTLLLGGINTYTGLTRLNAGTLALGADNFFSRGFDEEESAPLLNDVEINNGSTLDLGEFSTTAGNVTLNDGSIIGSGALAASALEVHSGSISANLEGIGTLIKLGEGTVFLSGNNSYSGDTLLNAGTLRLGSSNALGLAEGPGTIYFYGGTLQFTESGATDYSGRFSTDSDQNYNLSLESADVTFALPLQSSNGNLTLTGNGSLTLTAANTFGGTTTVGSESATLVLANPFALQNSTVNAPFSGRLSFGELTSATFGNLGSESGRIVLTNEQEDSVILSVGNNNNNSDFGGQLTGAGSLVKIGTGTLTFFGSDTDYLGSTNVSAGTLRLAGSDALPTGTAVTVDFGATLDISANSQTIGSLAGESEVHLGDGEGSGELTVGNNGLSTEFSGSIAGFGSLTKQGTGIFRLSGSNDYFGSMIVDGGTLQLGSDTALNQSVDVSVNNGSTFDVGESGVSIGRLSLNSGTVTGGTLEAARFDAYSGTISASLTGGADSHLIKDGEGTVLLSGSNSYLGDTVIFDGILTLGSNNSLPSDSEVFVLGRGTLDLGGFDASVSTVNVDGGNVSGSGSLTASTFQATSGTISANLAGEGADLFKSTEGTLTLTGTNTFTGGTVIHEGLINFNSLANFGTGSVQIDDFAGLQWATGTTTDISGRRSPLTGETIFDTNGNNVTFVNSLAGGEFGFITKLGDGTLTLAPGSTLGVGVDFEQGTVAISDNSALGAVPELNQPDHLFFNGGTLQTTAEITLASTRSTTLDEGGGTILTDSGTTLTYLADITGFGSLTKTGGGALVLSGSNDYSGNTLVSAGTLALGANDTLSPNSELHITESSVALDIFSGAANGVFLDGGSITGTGTLSTPFVQATSGAISAHLAGFETNFVKNGQGTVALSGENSLPGGTTINDGTLRLDSAGAIGNTGTISFGTTGVLEFTANNNTDYSDRFSTAEGQIFNISVDDGVNVTFASPLTASGAAVSKLGTGTLILTGENTYTGGTEVVSGTLALGSAGSIPTTGTITVRSGATLDIGNLTVNADNLSLGGGTITGTGTLNAPAFELTSGNLGATLGGTGSLTKTSTGTVTLTGTNTYTGPTDVNAGTLLVNGSLASNIVTVASGGTLGGSGSIAGATTIATRGTLSPGNSPGLMTFGSDLTLAAGSTTRIQIDGTARGTSFDALTVAGTLTYGGTLTIDFSTSTLLDTSYNLFAADAISGSFSAIEVTGFYTSTLVNTGGLWSGTTQSTEFGFTFSESTGNFLASGAAVPEPSTYALLALGALSLFVMRRRRNA